MCSKVKKERDKSSLKVSRSFCILPIDTMSRIQFCSRLLHICISSCFVLIPGAVVIKSMWTGLPPGINGTLHVFVRWCFWDHTTAVTTHKRIMALTGLVQCCQLFCLLGLRNIWSQWAKNIDNHLPPLQKAIGNKFLSAQRYWGAVWLVIGHVSI